MPIDLRTTIPRLNPACNVRTLPLGPEEGFVLSRVDGATSAADIGAMTGLGADVLATLQKLASLGALLDVPGAPPPPAPTPRPSAEPAAPAPAVRKKGPPKYSAAELDEPCDLDRDRKQRILELFYDLPTLSHYELLGVDQSADKKAIKAAYFKLAPEFHPDKFFRKSLGAFKPKMEAVFTRITEAEQVLTRQASRADYDAYLTQRQRTDEIEALLRGEIEPPPDDPPPPPPAPRQATTTSDRGAPPVAPTSPRASSSGATPRAVGSSEQPRPPAASPSVASPAPTASQTAAPRPPVAPTSPPRSPSTSQTTAPRPDDERLRRQALAAKLSSGHFSARAAPPPRAPAPPPVVEDAAAVSARHVAASDSLRRMMAAKISESAREQVDRYITSADEAVARGDAVAAANAYRVALAHQPHDAGLAEKSTEWSAKAAAVLAGGYLKQGEYEAKEGRWDAAARSLGRAAAGMPLDARVMSLAAEAALKAGTDLRAAAELAKRAVELQPGNVAFRAQLAEVYLAAKMPLAAKRELDAANQLDPKDSKVRALLERLR